MPRFGVFVVPPARNPFYRLGTSILGYDVRREQAAHADNFIRAQLPDFDEEFVKRPQKHGIHCTVVAPQECRIGDLPAIQYEMERILNCFAASTQFKLSAADDFVTYWGKKQQIAVLQYAANPAMLMLHTLLVAQLAQYVVPDIDLPTQDVAHEYHRIHHFNYPFVFDGYTPHFTLLFPYKGNQHEAMQDALYSLFGQFKQMIVEGLCLMMQADKDTQWTIVHEFHRHEYPKEVDTQ
ncbi:MAG: DUF1045 domain-containing protein [Phototrophicaceae bacterium]